MDNVDSSLQEVCSDMSTSFMITSDEFRETLRGSASIEQGSDADMNASESSDSNQDKFICDPCQEEEKQVKARGFCVVCSEYLCDDCCDFHKKQKILKTHTIRNVKDMPLNKSSMVKEVCVDICPIHSEKITEFFCRTCDQLGCSVCMVTGHRACSQVCYIPDFARDEACDNKCDDLKKILNSLLKKLSRERIMYNVNVSKNKRLRKRAKQSLQKQQNDIMLLLTKIFKTEEDNIDKMYDAFDKQLKSCYSQIDSFTNSLHTSVTDLQMNQTADHRCQLFIAMKMAEMNMKKFTDKVTEMETNNKVHTYEFQPNPKILETIKSEHKLGLIKLLKSEMRAYFEYESDITINSFQGTAFQPVGLCMLAEDVLIYADNGISSIQVVGVSRGIVESVTEVSSEIGDIARVEYDKVAVTFPLNQNIRIYSLTNDKILSIYSSLKVNGSCYGIDHSEGRLFVSYIRKDKRVEIMDMNGKILKCFRVDSDGKRLFQTPKYLAFSSNLQVIYISDSGRKTITGLTLDGEVLAIYQDENLICPKGICIDNCGSLFICNNNPWDWDSHIDDSIHHVSEILKTINIFKDSNVLHFPKCIAYCGTSGRLFINSSRDNKLTIASYAIKLDKQQPM